VLLTAVGISVQVIFAELAMTVPKATPVLTVAWKVTYPDEFLQLFELPRFQVSVPAL